MTRNQTRIWSPLLLAILVGGILLLVGCGESSPQTETNGAESTHETEEGILTLPALEAANLAGAPLKVIATTSIIGDVVAQVGDNSIDLTILMQPGQDPHSYEPGARELTAVADADIIFVNGWDLEETLIHRLEEIGAGVPIVPISANITPLSFGADNDDEERDEHAHSQTDPHVWFAVDNVSQWVKNAADVLGTLDPANAQTFADNAASYTNDLVELEAYAETQLAQIPQEKRFMVTNHDSLGYFAKAYDFELIGTVIPSVSTLAEPSANDLTELIAKMEKHDICTIFTETSVSDALAQTVASELSNCTQVKVVSLYTGTIGAAGSGAESYIDMFRANVEAVVDGLR